MHKEKKNFKKMASLFIVAVLLISTLTLVNAESVSPKVSPELISDPNYKLNVDLKVDSNGDQSGSIDYSAGGQTYKVYYQVYNDGKLLKFWTKDNLKLVSKVAVKGGDSYHLYDYGSSQSSDQGLVSPLNGGKKVPKISHFEFLCELEVVAPTETTPAPTETTPAPTETTPAPTETTPAPSESTPAPSESTPAPSESTPAPTETTPVPTESTPVPTESTPAPTETTPAPTETTPVPTETTPAPTETTPAPTETTPAPTETTPAPTESVSAPAPAAQLVVQGAEYIADPSQEDPASTANLTVYGAEMPETGDTDTYTYATVGFILLLLSGSFLIFWSKRLKAIPEKN